ncbi:MAG: SGNH/GDSL hydrolase family protein [Lachnospiraceae bacterium]|nr:SGNH/GDSL hydrolase family protein [Lachnospiraceae bacterium]
MKKKICILTCISLFLGAVALGCGGSNGSGATPTPWIVTATPTPHVATATPTSANTPTPTLSPTPEPDLFNGDHYFEAQTALETKLGKYYNRIFTNGLLSTGNSYRLREKLTKAQNGEEIVICYLGGSVTEGEGSTERTPQGYKKGYAYMSYEYIRDKYGKGDNVKYVNAAISGTGSDLGMVRADEDVLSYDPDIIFVEFAVNNDNSVYNKMTYEGLIRKFLKAENEPAVILLFSAATYAGQTQNYMKPMGTYYDLPMVSMKTALDVPQNLKVIEWKDFSNDTVHPKTDGHKLYAKLVAYLIDKAVEDTSATEYTFVEKPSVNGYDLYDEAVMIDNSNTEGLVKETGSFKAGTTRFSSTGNSDNHALTNGWSRAANSGSDGLKIDLTCSSFSVVIKQINSPMETSLDVYVDGKLKTTILTSKSGAWNNPVTTLVYVADAAGQHEIVIKPSAGSEGSGQTVLAFAYTK